MGLKVRSRTKRLSYGALCDAMRTAPDNVAAWRIVDDRRLQKQFGFPNTQAVYEFMQRLSRLSALEQRTPHTVLDAVSVEISLWTQEVDGLTHQDFEFAAKVDELIWRV